MTLQWRANRSPSREWLPQSLTRLKNPGQAQPWSGVLLAAPADLPFHRSLCARALPTVRHARESTASPDAVEGRVGLGGEEYATLFAVVFLQLPPQISPLWAKESESLTRIALRFVQSECCQGNRHEMAGVPCRSELCL